ncbi:DUF1800 domain-containing protein [Lysobacter sp. TY2-98]|uniref:DUF1800 domain-containing protein n=1 Tax=Lysobacter sp. TY2-98 TaxID=2290922 RepID=UPI000E208BC9|nr:DUF1800 domain-containing protein [Lysobacter sp. TY2-98]AXK71898.1 DUF1800 domain-containing protein [Lysobacter sp. TY2-98]
MKRSNYPMRANRVARRGAFWTVTRRPSVQGPTLAQKYGDGQRIRSQPFIRSVSPDVGEAASQLPADVLTLARAPFAVRMLRNLSFGPTKAAIAEFQGLGSTDVQRLANWVDWQLDYTSIDDSAVDARLSRGGYVALGKSLTQLWTDHVAPNPAWEVRMLPALEMQRAAFVRATYSRRQLLEMTVDFWHDHFSVYGYDYSAGPVFPSFDRDVIRKNAFGNFRTMLEDVAKHPSMLYFLDNYSNTKAGQNENWARELMELHTLGTEHYYGFQDPSTLPRDPADSTYPAGYTDIDVYEVAAAFTGWTLRDGNWQYPNENDGSFVYRAAWHDTNPKTILGKQYFPEQPDMKDGRDVLDRLASHPAVARHICAKIIRRFINDVPSQSLIWSAAQVFRDNWQAPDQLTRVLRHILNSTGMYNAWGNKTRKPFTAIVAAMRAGGSDWTLATTGDRSNEFAWRFGFTGHTPFGWPAPNGYPDITAPWSGSNSYGQTWRMLDWLTDTTDGSFPLIPVLANTRADVAAGSWTANNLVDYWCNRLLGYILDATRRQVLAKFLAQNGDPATYVITDTEAWSGTDLKKHYNQSRLKSMVSMILLSPEFLSR